MLGTGPDPETPDNDSKWVDEGGSVTISTLGKILWWCCGAGGGVCCCGVVCSFYVIL